MKIDDTIWGHLQFNDVHIQAIKSLRCLWKYLDKTLKRIMLKFQRKKFDSTKTL